MHRGRPAARHGDQVYIELLEANAQMLGMFAQGVEASRNWDGRQAHTVIDFATMSPG